MIGELKQLLRRGFEFRAISPKSRTGSELTIVCLFAATQPLRCCPKPILLVLTGKGPVVIDGHTVNAPIKKLAVAAGPHTVGTGSAASEIVVEKGKTEKVAAGGAVEAPAAAAPPAPAAGKAAPKAGKAKPVKKKARQKAGGGKVRKKKSR